MDGNNMRTFIFMVLLSLGLSGCPRLGPDFARPGSPVAVPAQFQNAAGGAALPFHDDPWWRRFNRPELDRLVAQALTTNLDLKKAAATVLQLRARLVATHAERAPQLGLEAQAGRAQQAFNLPGLGAAAEPQTYITESYNLALAASFEVDLWGRLARASEAGVADLLAAEENRLALAQTVTAEVVALYLQIEALEGRLEIARRSVESYRYSLEFVMGRYQSGLVSILDVRQARRTLAQGEAVLPALRRELGTSTQQLHVLVGDYPLAVAPGSSAVLDYQPLPEVPAGLPSELLERRPDLRAAEARLQAANARIGAARAGRFPRLSLTGQYGYSSSELNRLIEPQSEIYQLAAGLTQALFDAGRLRAVEDEARAAYEQAAADYAAAVLNAFFDVEKALLTRREELERLERLRTFRDEALETQRVAQNRYVQGLVDYLTVLNAQQTRFQAEDQVVLVELAVLTNQVALHRALGGGWADPGPVGSVGSTRPQSPAPIAPVASRPRAGREPTRSE